ncbi:MAG: hypothetical protein ACOCX4_05005 [Planctomycetota bacterium]
MTEQAGACVAPTPETATLPDDITGIPTHASLLNREGQPYGNGCDAFLCDLEEDCCRILMEGAAPIQVRPGARVLVDLPAGGDAPPTHQAGRVVSSLPIEGWGMDVHLRFTDLSVRDRVTLASTLNDPAARVEPVRSRHGRSKRKRVRRTATVAIMAISIGALIALGLGGASLWFARQARDPDSAAHSTVQQARDATRGMIVDEVKKEIEKGDLSPEEAKRLYKEYGRLLD